ncbi:MULTISPECIES: U32 family peptidase [unclassified Paludibacterium]|uniref:peptidase U32 family protein n=1 Tax=unclassified Paludibacterium TaxID=2618429 RepID=UPI001C03F91D|nr:U32 family peptidase [Paludibacterium sp. B53371]BEV71375.1 U32 family peptidase [Paludibacterium sp. THUN1379]
MSLLSHQVELLAPAKTVEIGREAILHGADAVYIGGPSFGARHNACNSVSDIAGLTRFAHQYHARIFATLNTILHDAELEAARKLIWQLYDAGVDALIIQDMGIVEMDLPPIQLHASTQCDIRDAAKARFLADAGFSQLVLARELSIAQIREIAARLDGETTLEYFIHGALCVAFSGQCYISHAETGRSANRGDCSQACRLPYTLTDQKGGVIAFDKHLLSMKDNNQSRNLEALLDAGVRSLKIEGRYKDVSYVKNITAHYRLLLDEIFERRPELAPASSGSSEIFFTPDPDKTFHRGSTDYFASGRQIDIGAFDSPKFVGVALGTVHQVGPNWLEIATQEAMSNGDGISYLHKREVIGMQLNTVKAVGHDSEGVPVWRCQPNDPALLAGLRPGIELSRNRDHAWELALLKPSAERRIGLWARLREQADGLTLSLTDADGCMAEASVAIALEPAKDAGRARQSLLDGLGKLGNSCFIAHDIQLELSQPWFVPASVINGLRRDAVAALEAARLAAWQRPPRKAAASPAPVYPENTLSYLANVYNELAWQFYRKHGVEVIEPAYEAHEEAGEVSLMITKHCLRFSFNLCPKQAKGVKGVMGQVRADPLVLKSGSETYTLKFECRPCEMHVMGKMKKHVLKSPPPSEIPAVAPLTFFKQRP